MPGALLMTLAVVVYGLGLMDLVHLGLALALHLVLGWAYLAAGILSAPRHSQTPAEPENPFAAGPPTGVPPT